MADDDRVTRLLVSGTLKRWGYEVVLCCDGKEAWDVLRREDAPNLVLLDWLMPEMDGIEVCKLIREANKLPYTYVILLTVKVSKDDIVHGLEAGADDYIAKPFDPEELRARLRAGQRIVELHSQLAASKASLEHANQDLLREIQERQAAQIALQRSEAKYRGIFDSASIGIDLLQRDGSFIEVNAGLARMVGYEREELERKTIFDLLHPHDLPLFRQNFDQLLRGESKSSRLEARCLRSDGSVFWTDVSTAMIQVQAADELYAVGVIMDITERKRAQRLLLQSQRSKAITELAGMVAHSFNNLLQVVIGGAHISLSNLELGNLEAVRETIDTMLRNSEDSTEKVKRLQYLARIEAGQNDLEWEVVDLSRTVHHAIEMTGAWWKIRPEREGINIALKRHLGPNCFIRGNDNELFELVVQLVKNAVEALPDGGSIEIDTRIDQTDVILEVRDDGIGIPTKVLNRLFEPFWVTTSDDALAIGLERCHTIVKRHNGTIQVTSKPGKGSTFRLIFPLAQRPVELPLETVPEYAGGPLHILLVDDMEPVLIMLRSGLEECGQKVFAALSGRKAVELFKVSKVDVIVCDLAMPQMNGWQVGETIKEICEKNGIPKPPFILLTGWGVPTRDSERLRRSGVDEVVHKPIDLTRLLSVIRQVFQQTKTDSHEQPERHSSDAECLSNTEPNA